MQLLVKPTISQFIGFALFSLTCSFANAHSLFIAINDNGDNTITVEAVFSTGGVAANAELRLESYAGRVFLQSTLDDEGKLTVNIPSEPYLVVVQSDKGHVAEEEGPERRE